MIDQKVMDALLDTMAPLDNSDKYARNLFYGDQGSGKTILACSFGEKLLYVESDPEGWVSLDNHRELLRNGRIHRMRYQGISQLEAICEAIESGQEPFSNFDHLVLDTASNIALLDLDVVVRARAKKDPGKNEDFPTLPDFGHNTERMRRVFTRILGLPIHVTMTAHAREDKDEKSGIMYTRPDFTPKLRKSIGRMCHLIGYMTALGDSVDDGEGTEYTRLIQVHPTRNIEAKSRIKGLPTTIPNFDINAVLVPWLHRGGELAEDELVLDDGNTVPGEVVDDVSTGLEVESEPKSKQDKAVNNLSL